MQKTAEHHSTEYLQKTAEHKGEIGELEKRVLVGCDRSHDGRRCFFCDDFPKEHDITQNEDRHQLGDKSEGAGEIAEHGGETKGRDPSELVVEIASSQWQICAQRQGRVQRYFRVLCGGVVVSAPGPLFFADVLVDLRRTDVAPVFFRMLTGG